MNRSDRWSSIFWLLFSVLFCVEAYKLNVGTFRGPGPGFFPFLIGVIFGLLAISLLFLSYIKPQQEKESGSLEKVRWKNILLVLTALYVYALILEKLGFVFSSFLFVAGLLWVIEGKKWYVLILTGGVAAMASYVIFQLLLHSRLPMGILNLF